MQDHHGDPQQVRAQRRHRHFPLVAVLAVAAVLASTRGGGSGPTFAQAADEGPAFYPRSVDGPWGSVELTPIVISPPLEYLGRELAPPQPLRWVFPGADRASVEGALKSAGMPPADVARLMTGARTFNGQQGIALFPDPALVRGLAPDVRARLYVELGKTPLNQPQNMAFRYRASSPAEWLEGAPIAATTRALVEPLLYRVGGFLFFADFDLVRASITDAGELQRLRKGLLRQATVVAGLRLRPTDDLNAIAEYWGRGGRRTDIRPLLESLADSRGGSSIDIVHLLPTLPRTHLYRYPRTTPEDLSRPLLVNCLWTALNFFNAEPDDRFLDEATAMATLKRDYYIIQDNYQLGDIIVLADQNNEIFHAAVHIAGDLIFAKNGATPLAPWSLIPLQDLNGHYVIERASGWTMTYLRRKDL